MRIVFFGTPDFSVRCLETLIKSKHEIAAVVTVQDTPKGRGLKLGYSPVKEFALSNGIDVLQPEKFKDETFLSELAKYNADIFVVVAFKILPQVVFDMPKYGSFNLHGSLLPKYRGAAPIQWSIIKGDTLTGLTTFKLADKVDTGNIYLREEVKIDSDDNFETLHDKMALVGANLIISTLDLIELGNFQLEQQDDSIASGAPKITKELCALNFAKPALEIHNLIRGISPYPGAFFFYNGTKIKIYRTKVTDIKSKSIGDIITTKKEIFIGCEDFYLEVLLVQQEGRKRLTAEEFLRGFSF